MSYKGIINFLCVIEFFLLTCNWNVWLSQTVMAFQQKLCNCSVVFQRPSPDMVIPDTDAESVPSVSWFTYSSSSMPWGDWLLPNEECRIMRWAPCGADTEHLKAHERSSPAQISCRGRDWVSGRLVRLACSIYLSLSLSLSQTPNRTDSWSRWSVPIIMRSKS